MSLYFEGGAVSVTDVAGATTLTSTCTALSLRNDGTDAVHINVNSATVAATTSYFKILSGGTLSIRTWKASGGIESFSYICAAAGTATLNYVGILG